MKIVWDEPKRRANLDKHGMDFADLNETFFDNALVLATYRNRWRAIGINIRGVISVIFATRGTEGISIVSMRPASRKERELYEESRR
ncbi:BrnT family toxin [Bradyrhizobium sp. Arg816]|uniref:BrnT family toxin n=1 Tax=Bradyrhizobium sp. Arg816 TaxID=2998491 RepID=UPI00249DE264|nr:BrnT family toxin [Bradyrhizobium sp. Arg816]MDI3559659.1 BrnT family toxin [Bradyrhizobium sp. Arg816]